MKVLFNLVNESKSLKFTCVFTLIFLVGFCLGTSLDLGWGIPASTTAAGFTAFFGLFLTIYNSYKVREHNRLIVKPHLAIAPLNETLLDKGPYSYTLTLSNDGLGPAIIKKELTIVHGKRVSTAQEFQAEIMDIYQRTLSRYLIEEYGEGKLPEIEERQVTEVKMVTNVKIALEETSMLASEKQALIYIELQAGILPEKKSKAFIDELSAGISIEIHYESFHGEMLQPIFSNKKETEVITEKETNLTAWDILTRIFQVTTALGIIIAAGSLAVAHWSTVQDHEKERRLHAAVQIKYVANGVNAYRDKLYDHFPSLSDHNITTPLNLAQATKLFNACGEEAKSDEAYEYKCGARKVTGNWLNILDTASSSYQNNIADREMLETAIGGILVEYYTFYNKLFEHMGKIKGRPVYADLQNAAKNIIQKKDPATEGKPKIAQ